MRGLSAMSSCVTFCRVWIKRSRWKRPIERAHGALGRDHGHGVAGEPCRADEITLAGPAAPVALPIRGWRRATSSSACPPRRHRRYERCRPTPEPNRGGRRGRAATRPERSGRWGRRPGPRSWKRPRDTGPRRSGSRPARSGARGRSRSRRSRRVEAPAIRRTSPMTAEICLLIVVARCLEWRIVRSFPSQRCHEGSHQRPRRCARPPARHLHRPDHHVPDPVLPGRPLFRGAARERGDRGRGPGRQSDVPGPGAHAIARRGRHIAHRPGHRTQGSRARRARLQPGPGALEPHRTRVRCHRLLPAWCLHPLVGCRRRHGCPRRAVSRLVRPGSRPSVRPRGHGRGPARNGRHEDPHRHPGRDGGPQHPARADPDVRLDHRAAPRRFRRRARLVPGHRVRLCRLRRLLPEGGEPATLPKRRLGSPAAALGRDAAHRLARGRRVRPPDGLHGPGLRHHSALRGRGPGRVRHRHPRDAVALPAHGRHRLRHRSRRGPELRRAPGRSRAPVVLFGRGP